MTYIGMSYSHMCLIIPPSEQTKGTGNIEHFEWTASLKMYIQLF